MSKKVMFVATVLRMHVLVFHLPYMRWFQEQGYEVHPVSYTHLDVYKRQA